MRQTKEEKLHKEFLLDLYERTKKAMREMADYYGLPQERIVERHWAKAQLILPTETKMPSFEEAELLSKKAIDSVRMTSLAGMCNGTVPGPRTAERLEKKAKQALTLAEWQDSLGKEKAASKQRARAEELQAEAAKLREKPVASEPMISPSRRRRDLIEKVRLPLQTSTQTKCPKPGGLKKLRERLRTSRS